MLRLLVYLCVENWRKDADREHSVHSLDDSTNYTKRLSLFVAAKFNLDVTCKAVGAIMALAQPHHAL